ncbi:cobyrinate a,c-diamide synthase [Selenomonas sp. TAMA-11512]|uniref:cobyrinate a,c-diamide synthase n=1 Tax=Selenomonas sp. TAMA-11512 TaxID=3095337 RepID=UPI00308BD84E|nr:cobyrinate a,c-diamide synthase [Selenomonas sp. TAMA-11512]
MRTQIPRLVVAAVSSGSGKTTLVTGLLRALRERGLRVQSYKVGPDYIDTGYHRLASGRPSHNLDSWLLPAEELRVLFARTAQEADIAVMEGVMGLYDGGRRGVSSTAEIAKLLDAPVLLVIDAKSMGASAAAIAMGYRDYDREVELRGVLLNRLGSPTHESMIREAMQGIGMPVLGAVRRDASLTMPERHLGLLPTEENKAPEVVDRMGELMERELDVDGILELAKAARPMDVPAAGISVQAASIQEKHVRIAVAHDEAFSFYYPESLAVLEGLGAEMIFFSPLRDAKLPEADALIIGGGFPEMFSKELARNVSMRTSIRGAAEAGLPVYAECGGYMYLLERLVDFAGVTHSMVGVLSGTARMTEKLQMVGYVEAELRTDTCLGKSGDIFHGHEFHFSVEQEEKGRAERPFIFTKLRDDRKYPAGQAWKNVLGSYLHIHFAGAGEAAVHFMEAARRYRWGA